MFQKLDSLKRLFRSKPSNENYQSPNQGRVRTYVHNYSMTACLSWIISSLHWSLRPSGPDCRPAKPSKPVLVLDLLHAGMSPERAWLELMSQETEMREGRVGGGGRGGGGAERQRGRERGGHTHTHTHTRAHTHTEAEREGGERGRGERERERDRKRRVEGKERRGRGRERLLWEAHSFSNYCGRLIVSVIIVGGSMFQ